MRNATLSQILDAVKATIAVAILFGLPLSQDQFAGLMVAAAAWGIVAVAINDRRRHPPEDESAG